MDECSAIKRELIDRYGRLSESVEKLLLLVVIKTICRKLHVEKVYVVDGQARFDVKPTTPISPERLSGNIETGFVFVSEFCFGLKLKCKNWKEDMLLINDHLIAILGLVDNV